jgi:hypothetical protein
MLRRRQIARLKVSALLVQQKDGGASPASIQMDHIFVPRSWIEQDTFYSKQPMFRGSDMTGGRG